MKKEFTIKVTTENGTVVYEYKARSIERLFQELECEAYAINVHKKDFALFDPTKVSDIYYVECVEIPNVKFVNRMGKVTIFAGCNEYGTAF